MKDIVANEKLIAKCGLYCGACKRYLIGKCPGCLEYEKAEAWCKVRTCNIEHDFTSCADCNLVPVESCKAYNNFMAKLFGFIFRSNRGACIERIRDIGPDAFAKEMSRQQLASIKR